jgi:5'-methylthioadenosine phosphorylase
MDPNHREPSPVGIIGGSGLYQLDGIEDVEEFNVDTPFGSPSDTIKSGTLQGRRVFFLPRHGRGHTIAPHEINHRANIYALKSLGARWIVCVTAVGSLKEEYRPRHIVLPSQYYDRTSQRKEHTFFGNGIVAHVSFSDPTNATLRSIIESACAAEGAPCHNGGTYVGMDGPAFSTRSESDSYRHLGFDVIGMTNLPEAKLAREAQIALATIACITDYDCWKTDVAPVTVQTVVGHLNANAELAKRLLERVIPNIPADANEPEHRALEYAIVTQRSYWPQETLDKLGPILSSFH